MSRADGRRLQPSTMVVFDQVRAGRFQAGRPTHVYGIVRDNDDQRATVDWEDGTVTTLYEDWHFRYLEVAT